MPNSPETPDNSNEDINNTEISADQESQPEESTINQIDRVENTASSDRLRAGRPDNRGFSSNNLRAGRPDNR